MDIKGLNEKRLIKAFSLDNSEIFKINTMPEFKQDLLALLDDLEYYKKSQCKAQGRFYTCT